MAISLLALLTSCGGGGNGNTPSGDLQVHFSGYLASLSTVYKSVSFSPSLTDLNGNTPHYSVSSGSLPAGLSLNPDTGVVSGILTSPGLSNAQIELTAKGFTGSLHASFGMTVKAASLTYTGSAGSSLPTDATTFDVGAPLRTFSVYLLDPDFMSNGSSGLGPLVPAPGVVISYRVAAGSALPAGLTLDAGTGLISGSPAAAGRVDTNMEATLAAVGGIQSVSAMIPFSITAPTASITYSPHNFIGRLCLSSPDVPFATAPVGGTPVSFTPILNGGQPGDMLSNFSASLGALAFLSLDTNTGTISGTSFEPNDGCGTSVGEIDIQYTLTRGAYSIPMTTHVGSMQ